MHDNHHFKYYFNIQVYIYIRIFIIRKSYQYILYITPFFNHFIKREKNNVNLCFVFNTAICKLFLLKLVVK